MEGVPHVIGVDPQGLANVPCLSWGAVITEVPCMSHTEPPS